VKPHGLPIRSCSGSDALARVLPAGRHLGPMQLAALGPLEMVAVVTPASLAAAPRRSQSDPVATSGFGAAGAWRSRFIIGFDR
jgi:hypothetical protein